MSKKIEKDDRPAIRLEKVIAAEVAAKMQNKTL
jgi:hypothetical protein